MENKKFKNAIKEIKEIRMTESEKKDILYNIFNLENNERSSVQSPWSFYSFFYSIKNNHLVYYVVIPLIIILSGGGVVFASQDSLPDDILYPIKVKLLEPAEGALKFSKIEKAKYQSELAKNRLIEAQILANENKLDEPTEEKLNKLLINHTVSLNKTVNKVHKDNSKKEIDELITDFSAEMNANARILEVINEKEDKYKDTYQGENEDNKKGNKISKTAKESANSIKNNLKDEKNKNKDDYKNKKDKVEILIEDIDKDFENKDLEEFYIEDEFIDDTYNKIDEAKKYLEEAGKREIEGDEDEASSLLFDSESSIKEAEIFINSEFRFNDRNRKRD
ncbi:TPA: hypothetical protein DIC38_01520 [Candidatus Nomurabacteria bacterium]|nr:MAG: hypothetical protein O210_OD1C00001G0428 [Parcubacteria bacterium RAAC4_OD1_1]HCY26340.1 hypothetical protein [Candidatus Nomurabacteria bacterium]